MPKIAGFFKLNKEEDHVTEDLKTEIFTLHDKLKKQEQEFNMADDDDLIEALIYEQKALQARFALLMKKARETGLEINFFDR